MKINTTEIRLEMARKCMSSEKLAEKVGCSVGSIRDAISGRRTVTTEKLGMIAQALEIDPAKIVEF